MWIEVLLLALLSAVQLAPIFYCFWKRQLSLLALCLLGHFICFSLGSWYQLLNGLSPFLSVRTPLVLLGATSITLLIWIVFSPRQRPLQETTFPVLSRQGWGALLIGNILLFGFLNFPPEVGQLLNFLKAGLLCFWLGTRPKSTAPLEWLIVLTSSGLAVFDFLYSGSLGLCLTIAIFQGVFYCYYRAKKLLAHLVVLSSLLFSLQPIKAQYREFMMSHSGVPLSIHARAVECTREVWSKFERHSKNTTEKTGPFSSSVNRLHDNSLDLVLKLTPAQVPFWQGGTYSFLRYFWIPRLFWSDKPIRSDWHLFGKLYNVLAPSDRFTSITFNYWAEAYMNYGHWGLFMVTLLMGCLLTLMEHLWRQMGRWEACSLALLASTCFMPSDLTSLLIAFLSISVVLLTYLILYVRLKTSWISSPLTEYPFFTE